MSEDINWFWSSERRWTSISDGSEGRAFFFIILLTTAAFMWFASFTQGGRPFIVSLFYILFTILALFAWQIESIGDGANVAAIIDWGSIDKWPTAIVLGIATGIGTLALIHPAVGSLVPLETNTGFEQHAPIVFALQMTIWFIPIAEEAFFGSLMGPQFAESFGVVTGLFLTVLLWSILHFALYGSTFSIIIILVMFRSIVYAETLMFGTSLPGFVAHVLVNAGGVIIAV